VLQILIRVNGLEIVMKLLWDDIIMGKMSAFFQFVVKCGFGGFANHESKKPFVDNLVMVVIVTSKNVRCFTISGSILVQVAPKL
jgi:hypothetical protein